MNSGEKSKRVHPSDLNDAFSSGLVTATGERIFVPIRKKAKIDDSEARSNLYKAQSSQMLSSDEIKLVRMQNQIQVEGDDLCGPILHFHDIGLCAAVEKRLTNHGIKIPSPIQMQAIPLILTGRDIVIHSETGSGKTLAFLLPILKMFQQTPPSADPAVVIIEPTRELASQVLKECAYFMTAPLVHDFSPIQFYDESLDPHFFTPDGRFQHRVLGAWGGESVQDQRTELQKGIDVIVSTPGRLIDLMGKKLVRLDHTKVFILDEADKAVDIEMENQIRTIANMLPEQGTQTILCSATFPISVKRLINSCITDPITVRINAIDETRGGLSSSVVVNTIVTTCSNRFVGFICSDDA